VRRPSVSSPWRSSDDTQSLGLKMFPMLSIS
jgi:hypothetical protein